jgi:phage shock protein C
MFIHRPFVRPALAILFAFLPLILALVGVKLGDLLHCKVEIIEYRCGNNFINELLTYMVFAHWFAVITIPLGLLLSLILLSVDLYEVIRRRHNRRN